ncbi:MAG: TetR/AcrR family transcriptional regulator [Chloroflexi bacterium]|nr:TetR/AcrR family transcriptional regulator [Chloroflexota bacterium]
MEDKIDRRVKRSQNLLGEALMSLILEKGYERVTIRDITERADVAYVTFFRHYKSRDELLAQCLQTGLRDLQARIEAAARQARVNVSAEMEGQLIFEHVRANGPLYRVLMRSQGASQVRQQTLTAIETIFLNSCKPLSAREKLIPRQIAAHHIAASLLSLIEWWLEHEMPYPVERMGQLYDALIIHTTLTAL